MPAWLLPIVIQAGEALLLGIGTGVAAYQTTGDLHGALLGGFSMFIGKLLPTQVLGAKPA